MLRIDDLQYKGLKLYQDTDGFCFGTDAVLLAAFARIRKGERIADICAGNGIIALLTTARCAPSYCLAAELQPEAAQLCRKNVEFNSMTDIIEVCQADVRLLGGNGLAGSFDAVTCNPPYSRTTAPATDSLQKRMARQEAYLHAGGCRGVRRAPAALRRKAGACASGGAHGGGI